MKCYAIFQKVQKFIELKTEVSSLIAIVEMKEELKEDHQEDLNSNLFKTSMKITATTVQKFY